MSERTTRTLRRQTGVTATRRLRTPMLYERFHNPREPVTAPEETDSMRAGTAAPMEQARRESMIAEAAYYRSERRSFAPGGEFDDWLEAEREIDSRS
jgi:hypothetical protein